MTPRLRSPPFVMMPPSRPDLLLDSEEYTFPPDASPPEPEKALFTSFELDETGEAAARWEAAKRTTMEALKEGIVGGVVDRMCEINKK